LSSDATLYPRIKESSASLLIAPQNRQKLVEVNWYCWCTVSNCASWSGGPGFHSWTDDGSDSCGAFFLLIEARPAQTGMLCRKVHQNLVCICAKLNSRHRLKIE